MPTGFENLALQAILSVPAPLRPLVLRTASVLASPSGRRNIVLGSSAVVGAYYYAQLQKKKARFAALGEEARRDHLAKRKERAKRSQEFSRDLQYLLKIVIPGVTSKEMILLLVHTAFLFSRTFISIAVASLDGRLVKTIVDRDGKGFVWALMGWLGVAVPATFANSMIKYLESKLQLAFRSRLVDYSYSRYMRHETYYRVGNLDSRLSNADQCLTEDISKFSEMLAHLYSQISKPMLDVVVMTLQLVRMARMQFGQSSSAGAPAFVAIAAIWTTTAVLKAVRPPFGKMIAQKAELEGELRFVHSRLITNAEEVAFYGGHEIEESTLRKAYQALASQLNHLYKSRIVYNAVEGYLMKYFWSATGLCMIAIPPFLYEKVGNEGASADDMSQRAAGYTTSKKLLVSASDAIERLMLAIKEVTELEGYTGRVATMLRVFDDMENNRFQKAAATDLPDGWKPNGGRVQEVTGDDSYVTFENVPIVSPNQDILVKSMSFEVKRGMHLLITGPNGCGKSSLFRILGGVWPPYSGIVHRPRHQDMFYIPQRPYLVLGNLRDQIIYPDKAANVKCSDDELMQILRHAHLESIWGREGGWDSVRDWKDVLSGGEKQRIGMARVFYHKPKFAILDECTSAVSIDVEGQMYQHAIDQGVTLLTVTHRPSLWKFHKYLLKFDGEGGYKFSQLDASSLLSLKDEKAELEAQLKDMPNQVRRLKELNKELGEDSEVLDSTDLSQSLMESLRKSVDRK